ncbi:unnamed protein product [Ranitomeya imitator]|uniref:Peptidase M12B domain-containing protein n=1 Tax=Ranitomeya imitator TaxID=111125 RepID=A0ABN9MKC6_9NEOB|nr:unnamed protein product [Ranitomeya imitator]
MWKYPICGYTELLSYTQCNTLNLWGPYFQKHKHNILDTTIADLQFSLSNIHKYVIFGGQNEQFNSSSIIDFIRYNKYGRNIDNVKMHLFGVVNYMNTVYKTINIFVALIGIEIWDSTDQINVVSDYHVLLQRFQEWRIQNLLPRRPHDNAQFITNVDFDGNTVGLATVSAMCGANSAGVIQNTFTVTLNNFFLNNHISYLAIFSPQDHSSNAASVGFTVAHEMGHNLGMDHHDFKTCKCEAPACVMNPVLSSLHGRLEADTTRSALLHNSDHQIAAMQQKCRLAITMSAKDLSCLLPHLRASLTPDEERMRSFNVTAAICLHKDGGGLIYCACMNYAQAQ